MVHKRTAMTDLMVSLFVVPRFFFPIIGGHSLGILLFFNISIQKQIYIGFACCGAMIASVAVLFIYRHQATIGEDHFLKIGRKSVLIGIIAFNYLIYTNMTLPALFTAPDDQLMTKIEHLRIERCPPKDIFHPDVYILQPRTSLLILLPYLTFLIVFVGAECGLLAFHCSWFLFFSTLRQKLSKKTRMMQVKFLFALLAQIAIPTTLCYAPIFYMAITSFIDHYWQFANDICVFVFSTHGMISSICLLLFYDCYRNHLLLIFCRIVTLNKLSAAGTERNSLAFTARNSIHNMTVMI